MSSVRGQGPGVEIYASRLTSYALRITHQSAASPWDASRTTSYTIFAAVLFILLLLGFWFFLSSRDDGSVAEIRRRGTLRVGLDASFPPFESIDANGQITGLDIDIARAIAADVGVEAEFVNIGFDGLYDALLAHRVDLIISGLPYDPHWTKDVAYTRNYFNAGQVLVTRADDQTIQAAEDLAGHTVAVEWGSQAEMEGRRLSEEMKKKTSEVSKTSALSVKLIRQDSAAAALDAVLIGQADAAIVDAPSAMTFSQKESGEGDLKIVTYLTDEWYAAAVHIQSRELLAAANQTLSRLDDRGEMEKLQAKWFRQK